MEGELNLERTENDIMDELIYDEYLEEPIASAEGLCISIDREVRPLNIAYFKVHNHISVFSSTHVARLHFKDNGMEYHIHETLHKKIWPISSKEIKNVIALLNAKCCSNPKYSNWQMACFQWNRFNELLPLHTNIDEYFTGAYDKMYPVDDVRSKAFVPSTQEMPDEWIFDPPKEKQTR